METGFFWSAWRLLWVAFILNLVLAVFNILPIPPLDGYSLVSTLFRRTFPEFFFRIDRNRQADIERAVSGLDAAPDLAALTRLLAPEVKPAFA